MEITTLTRIGRKQGISGSMNDTKLKYIMRRYRPLFRGVFGKNELNDIKVTYPFCVISNESDFGTRGKHWVAICFDMYGNCDYFDPYGDMPVPDRRFIDKHINFGCGYDRIACCTLRMNRKQIQSLRSDVCEQYCISV